MTPTTFPAALLALLVLLISVVLIIGGFWLIVVGRERAWRHQPAQSVVLQSIGVLLIAGTVLYWLAQPLFRGAL